MRISNFRLALNAFAKTDVKGLGAAEICLKWYLFGTKQVVQAFGILITLLALNYYTLSNIKRGVHLNLSSWVIAI